MTRVPRVTTVASSRIGATVLLPVLVGTSGCGTGGAGQGALPDSVTYAGHVAPIVFDECASCHRPGGSAPFSLLTYAEVKGQGPRIAQVVAERTMPPWLPEPGKGRFAGERRLSEREIALVRRWVEQDMPLGDPEAIPDFSLSGGWQLGEPDLVIAMRKPYTVPGTGGDQFRNFVLPIPVDTTRFVRAVELDPGNPRVVHHAVIKVDPTGSARRLDAREPGPGYDGMFASAAAESPGGFFLGWTPGRVPHPGDSGMAWRLDPGTDLVVQLHLRPRGEAQEVRAEVALYFASGPPSRVPYLVTLGSQSIDIPPGDSSYTVEDTYELPVPVRVLGVYPHAHYLGREIEGFAELPDGGRRWLLHIAEWNFNWQDAYRYEEPVTLPAGTKLVMRIRYDNTAHNPLNPHDPPRRVVYGPESSDEMGNLFIQALPADSTDLQVLHQDFARQYLDKQIAGYRFRLDVDSTNAVAHNQLGAALRVKGRLDDAIEHFRRALRDKPDFGIAAYNLGWALEAAGEPEEAIAAYRRAVRLLPDDARAHYNLANALQSRGRVDEAIRHYTAAVALDSTHANAHNNLGNALRQRGRIDEAVQAYRRALAGAPDHPDANNNLGNLLRARGSLREAVGHYRRALAGDPEAVLAHYNLGRALVALGDTEAGVEHLWEAARRRRTWSAPLTAIAWIRATHPDADLRRPTEAIQVAAQAADLTDHRHPLVLDALAAGYAAAGEFGQAVTTAERALALASAGGAPELAREIRRRVALYRSGRPFIDAGGAN